MKSKNLRAVLATAIFSMPICSQASEESSGRSPAESFCNEPNTEEYQKAKSAFLTYHQASFTNKSALAALEAIQEYIKNQEPEAALYYCPNAQTLIQGHLLCESAQNAINNKNLSTTEREQIVDRYCTFWKNARITE